MFKPEFRKKVEPLVPRFAMRLMDPFHSALRDRLDAATRAIPSGARVLDVGAGECHHRQMVPQANYIALDRGIGDSSWDYRRIHVIADAHAIPFQDGAFDAVLNVQVLEHLYDPATAVREMTRVLRPGGRLILSTVFDWEIHQHPNDFFRFTRFGLEHLFAKAGFDEWHVEPLGGFFWLLAFRLMNVLSFFQSGWRWIIFVLLAPVFGFLLPAVLYFMDRLDRKRDYTLGYFCWCRKRAD